MDRRHLRFALSVTVLALPILVVDNLTRHDANAEPGPAGNGLGGRVNDAAVAHEANAAAAARRQEVLAELAAARQVAAERAASERAAAERAAAERAAAALTAVAPVTTMAPTTTVAAATAPPVTAPAPPPTTAPPTTAPAPPPPVPAQPPVNTEEGTATWYRQPLRYAPDGCAHKTLPFGTVVTVTNLNTGGSTFCIVSDRGPYGEGRIIDLDDDVFARLAPLSVGLIPVIISWQ